VLETPAINDPTATVTLDIYPPQAGESADCSVWHYHYGTPPPLSNNKGSDGITKVSTAQGTGR
jgi:hypothetical protein